MKSLKLTLLATLLSSAASHADVRIWNTALNTHGNVGGRLGADALCDADPNKPVVAASTTRAFISINAADEIRDMPALYNIPTNEIVFRADGTTQVAPNWAGLLNAGSTNLVNSVNIGPFPAGGAFTFSSADGALHASSCLNGTSNNGADNGMAGIHTSTNGGYIETGVTNCSFTTAELYCVTYTAPATVSSTPAQVPTLNPWLLSILSVVFAGFIYRKNKR